MFKGEKTNAWSSEVMLMQSYGTCWGLNTIESTLDAIVTDFSLFNINPIITHIYQPTLTMIPYVKELKSPNITPNPLRVTLNNLHYEQRCIDQAK